MRFRFISAGLLALTILIIVGFGAPVHKDREYYESRGDIVWEVPTDKKVIALTFDDGPHTDDTPAILDLLKKYHAKATFFVIGRKAERYPDVLKREASEGHEIANHTYSHPYYRRQVPLDKLEKEIARTEQVVFSITGKKTAIFRPPGGYYNDEIVKAIHNQHYQMVLWSWHQDTRDWSRPGVNRIVHKVLDNARGGDIVLLHDDVNRSQTVEALKQILPELRKRDFHFVTVSQLMTYKSTRKLKEEHKHKHEHK